MANKRIIRGVVYTPTKDVDGKTCSICERKLNSGVLTYSFIRCNLNALICCECLSNYETLLNDDSIQETNGDLEEYPTSSKSKDDIPNIIKWRARHPIQGGGCSRK